MHKISTLVCTYHEDDADNLSASLNSLIDQIRSPDEILIVEDGPLPSSLNITLNEVEETTTIPFRRVSHEENRGHGAARRTAVCEAAHDLVAIHDSDDLAVPERLKWSIEKLTATDADLVGGYIEEFENNPDNPHAVRKVPCDPTGIHKMAKLRSPVNHTTVLARREAILEAGNYRPVGQMEDYELWVRMIMNGCHFVNIPRILAKVRAGDEMYKRRGGISHVKEELRLQSHFAEVGFVSRPRSVVNFTVRSVPKLLPNKLRDRLYTTLFRET